MHVGETITHDRIVEQIGADTRCDYIILKCSSFDGGAMETVGIRELKTHLSRHLKRVRAGARLLITERGRAIATISPVEASTDLDWAHQLVAEGRASWNGRKPAGAEKPVKLKGRKTASAVVLEDRR